MSSAILKAWTIKKVNTKVLVRIDYKIILQEETTQFIDVNFQNQNIFLLNFLLFLY